MNALISCREQPAPVAVDGDFCVRRLGGYGFAWVQGRSCIMMDGFCASHSITPRARNRIGFPAESAISRARPAIASGPGFPLSQGERVIGVDVSLSRFAGASHLGPSIR